MTTLPPSPGIKWEPVLTRPALKPWSHGSGGLFEPLQGYQVGVIGAGNEARTRDLNLGKVALYQLSYSRTGKAGNCREAQPQVKALRCSGA